jgi:transcriptional regulator with GAF, ATPase, and Fis domain
VRELQNVIERAVIRSRDGRLRLEVLRGVGARAVRPASQERVEPVAVSLGEIKDQERNLILDALAKAGGKIYGPDGAAARLGVKPTTLSSRIHRGGLKRLAGV